MEFGSNSEISKNQYGRRVVLIHHFSNLWIKVFHFQTLYAMKMLTQEFSQDDRSTLELGALMLLEY